MSHYQTEVMSGYISAVHQSWALFGGRFRGVGATGGANLREGSVRDPDKGTEDIIKFPRG